MESVYGWGVFVTWVVTFLAAWIYAIAEYGYLLGVGLGWLPAMIVAMVVSILWPVLAAIVAAIVVWLIWTMGL